MLLRRSTNAPAGSLQKNGFVHMETGGGLCPKTSAAVAEEIGLLAKEGVLADFSNSIASA